MIDQELTYIDNKGLNWKTMKKLANVKGELRVQCKLVYFEDKNTTNSHSGRY